RVGDTRAIPVNCRVIAATNADLPALVKKGEFREDLYFRLKVVTLKVPPLRERKEDIPLLAERFLEAFSLAQNRSRVTASSETLRVLMAHSWPGNVRELKHALESGVVFCRGPVLEPQDIQLERAETLHETATEPAPVAGAGMAAAGLVGAASVGAGSVGASSVAGMAAGADSLSLEDNEHQAIIRALERTAWVKKTAADLLGISRRAIHYKIKKYNIQIPGKDQDE
ncbi:MAG: helix-turn-helix domain-containing protein, partial [Humidesulfovibrio sp.]|nr:helix-turn-helix domain-containing protein [Humidesulfovibrio sp.]